MNLLDILILLLIAVLVVMAWRSTRRHGGCSGNCESCGKSCSQQEQDGQEG